MTWIWNRMNRREERGAVFVLAAAGVVLATIAAALAVDLGRLASEKRTNQKIADLAALDAVRDFANMQTAATNSAIRNGFVPDATHTITAIEGTIVNGNCQAAPGSGKVCVTVTSPLEDEFRPGSHTVRARALATKQEGAAFTIGSSLASASLDTELPILNGVFNKLLQTSGTVNLVSYQGLATSNVKLRNIQTQLGFGTLNELLTANLTAGQLLQATSTVLDNQGTVAAVDAATKLASLSAVTTNTATFKLGDYIKVAQGFEEKALDGEVNVLQLITAGAELANKNNFVDAGAVIDLPVSLPAPLNTTANLTTKLGIKVIEGPELYIGPEGGPTPPLETSQVEVTLTPHVKVDFTNPLFNVLSLLVQVGTASLRLEGDMPVKFTGAGALGVLEDVRCSASDQGITVGVTSLPVATESSATLSIVAQTVTVPLVSDVKVNVVVHPTNVSSTPGGPFHPVFNYDADFTPPDPDGQTTPGAPVGLTATAGTVDLSVGAAGITEVLGLVTGTLKLDVVESAIIGPILNPIFTAVANRLTSPAFKALGIALGPVDVTAPAEYFDPAACGTPSLIG